MSDYILKQNAGRGGAVILTTGGSLPAGEYVSMTTIGAITATTLTTPLISSGTLNATIAIPAGVTINTLFTGGTITGGPAIFYKGVTV